MNATHHVHIYTVIRVKVAVEANDQRDAMKKADQIFSAPAFPVRLVPVGTQILDAEVAEEVLGYLVDDAGDDMFAKSRHYGPDHEPEVSRPPCPTVS